MIMTNIGNDLGILIKKKLFELDIKLILLFILFFKNYFNILKKFKLN